MSKRLKIPKSPRKEGADAALSTQARSANPYPHSNADKRDEWFAGYDTTLEKSNGDKSHGGKSDGDKSKPKRP